MKRLFSILAILLFSFISVGARAKYSNYVQAGGKSVKTSSIVTYLLMESFPASTVTVYLTGTTTLASIYTNNTGTTKANPFTSDSRGYYEFYADNGFYDVKFSGTGILSPWTTSYIALSDPTEGYNPLSFGAKCDGTTNDLTALTAVKAIIGSVKATITLPKTTPCRTNSISFPLNITIDYSASGGFYPNTSNTVTIVGPEIGPDTKRYYNATSGLGTVSHAGNTKLHRLIPEYYGAVGDKTTDDYATIQATLTDAGTTTNSATVELASTSYLLTGGLTIPTKVNLIGKGYQSELYYENAAGISTGITVNGSAHIDIKDLRVTGSSSVPTLSRGIYIISSTYVTVQNVWEQGAIFNPPNANLIVGIGTTQSSHIKVLDSHLTANGFIDSGSDVYISAYDLLNFAPTSDDVQFLNNNIEGSSTSFSILMFDVSNSRIADNKINQNNKLGTNHTASGYGIAVYGAVGRCTNITVTNNFIKNTAGFGLYLASVDHAVAHGNILQDVIQQQTGGALALSGMGINDVNFASIMGGSIIDSAQQGIWISGGSFITVAGVPIYSPAKDGIRLAGTPSPTDISITDCLISDPGEVGINIPVASPIIRATVHHNTVLNAGTYGIVANAVMDCTIDHNIVKNPTNDGILILDAVNSIRTVVDGNTISGILASMKGIAIYGFDHIVTNNTIRGSSTTSTRGISLDGPCTDCLISNNRVRGFAIGVYALNSVRSNVTNNILRGNTAPLNLDTTTTNNGNSFTDGVMQGTVTLIAGDSGTISTTEVTDSNIIIYKTAAGGTASVCSVASVSVGNSFKITCSSIADTSTYAWWIKH